MRLAPLHDPLTAAPPPGCRIAAQARQIKEPM